MTSITSAHWQTAGVDSPGPAQRLIASCLLASVALHAALLLALPGWWRTTPPEIPPVMDVILVPAEIPNSPAELPRQEPKPVTNVPVRAAVVPVTPAVPVRTEIAVSQTSAEPTLPAIVETARAPVTAVPAPAATRSEPVTTPPAFNAAYLRNPPPRYPLAARRNGDEGTVMLRVLVAIDGGASRVELDRSSGSASLDSAALEAVRNWRFVPARRGSQNVEDWVRVPVVFRIES